MPTFDALQEALESELDGWEFEAQNENSDNVSVAELESIEVKRG